MDDRRGMRLQRMTFDRVVEPHKIQAPTVEELGLEDREEVFAYIASPPNSQTRPSSHSSYPATSAEN